MDEMKIGEYKKFNDYCGIAYVKNYVTNKNWYVVYADTWENKIHENELGRAIGKGNTMEEAFIDTIKFLIDREKRYEEFFDDNEENIMGIITKAFRTLEHHQLTNEEKVVLPMESYEHFWDNEKQDNNYRIKENEFQNGDVGINKDGKADEFCF